MFEYKKLNDSPLANHSLSNIRCKFCSEGYPQACHCGGLLHAGIHMTESYGRIQMVQCDSCGKTC